MKKQTHQFGILAEKSAMWFLRLKGYKILFWRYKTFLGEIDIIAKKGKMIVIVEVKARKSQIIIEEVLRPKQVERVKRATEIFLSKNPQFQSSPIRFDFLLINKFLLPNHYKNFW